MNILFVNMPFSYLWPSLGVSLLKGDLERMGHRARVEYLNLRFTKYIGEHGYDVIAANQWPSQLLVGEWVFSHCLFPDHGGDGSRYLELVRSEYPNDFSPQMLELLWRSRAAAEPYLDACFAAVDWGSYELVGFTTTFSQNVASLALAARIKASFPHVRIAFGGANCEDVMGLQLHRSFPFVDFVCSGEADLSLPMLVRCLAEGGDGHNIPGIISRRNGVSTTSSLAPERVHMDDLPYPIFDDFFEQHRKLGIETEPVLPVETSRGCWWGAKQHCTFCGLNGQAMTFRAKSPARATQEISDLSRRHGLSKIHMVDNILDMRYFKEVLPQLRDQHLNLHIFTDVKANLTRDQVCALRDAGVNALQPGLESLSSSVLQLMRKGCTALQNVQLLKWCKEYGVACCWNLLYGFPGEDPASYESMISLIESLQHLQPPDVCAVIRLDRFSPYFKTPKELGIFNLRPYRWYSEVYDLPEEDLTNLAYYFEFDFADGRDPEAYAKGVRAAVQRWRETSGNRLLVYTDEDDRLVIWDFRPNAVQTTTALTGAERAVYLFCDQNQSLATIQAKARPLGLADAGTAELLGRLVEARLMARADGRYLSLAIPMPASAAAEAVVSRLTRSLASDVVGTTA
jgi:ribosomal peptide maturation radical SAM protein 1